MNSLCSRQEAAALLGLSPQTLAKWSMTGKNLSVIRISNRCVRYSRSEIETFIEKCTSTGSGTQVNNEKNGDHNDK